MMMESLPVLHYEILHSQLYRPISVAFCTHSSKLLQALAHSILHAELEGTVGIPECWRS